VADPLLCTLVGWLLSTAARKAGVVFLAGAALLYRCHLGRAGRVRFLPGRLATVPQPPVRAPGGLAPGAGRGMAGGWVGGGWAAPPFGAGFLAPGAVGGGYRQRAEGRWWR
jgi:hypothetical protein